MPSPSRYYSSTAAKTTLSNSISAGSSSLELAAASNLPILYPYTLILEKDTANEEVVEVTGLVGTSYQITRNIDGSGAKSHAVGALVEHGVSARDFTESRAHEVASSAHNVTGNIVGTGGAQTLTDKTLTTATLGSALNANSFKITNLATPTSSSDAVRKDFADAQVLAAATSASSASLSASSAAASASSALTSASSAATSAASALTSQSSAATSASSAATSASTMLASVTAAATSAASALTSQTAAANSATAAATSAASSLTSQTSAAVSASSAATSATSAANSATTAAASVATISGYATTALNSASAAATSATSAALSASSAATSATSAATSATSADSAASIAIAQASNASASATAAATSATSASNSATAASTSAASAATSASSALTSQTAAATSAASAATSASSAATSYDNFDDRYLGSKATAPSVDNDGNTLLVGAIYWNSTLNNMYVWSGSTWVQIATTSIYSAPTLGSTTIASGTTYSSITALTLNNGALTGTLTAGASSGTSGQYLQSTGTGVQWSSVSGYSAPTLGTTSIASGATVTTINGMTKIVSAIHASLDASGYEQDITLMNIMGAW